jgi:hypothetical protein
VQLGQWTSLPCGALVPLSSVLLVERQSAANAAPGPALTAGSAKLTRIVWSASTYAAAQPIVRRVLCADILIAEAFLATRTREGNVTAATPPIKP